MAKQGLFIFILSLGVLLSSCEKSEEIIALEEQESEDVGTGTTLFSGSFKGASGHTTTGTATVLRSSNNSLSLTFQNFKTDNGPDLRIYVAEDIAAKNFIEISSKVENGNKSYDLPANLDLTKHKFVLIWCKAFSVNFGYVELKAP